MKRPAKLTPLERRWYDLIHSLPCGVCQRLGCVQETPTELHHIGSEKLNLLSIPLCRDHHRNERRGWHGARMDWKRQDLNELMIYQDTVIAAEANGLLKLETE